MISVQSWLKNNAIIPYFYIWNFLFISSMFKFMWISIYCRTCFNYNIFLLLYIIPLPNPADNPHKSKITFSPTLPKIFWVMCTLCIVHSGFIVIYSVTRWYNNANFYKMLWTQTDSARLTFLGSVLIWLTCYFD